jgi:hypothetical protein
MTTTARIRLALEGQGQVVQGIGQVQGSMASLRSSMASLAGGLSVGATVGQLVKVQREFDVLNSSLITVTGGSAAAQREMQWIKTFASTTPFGLAEVTSAFVKMKALGLDPSEKALLSYGNTASAMGKSLNQMIEAVADASTGEFERLRDFGIKARKQGDDVALTFRGVTTTVGNNANEITAYLQRIGNVDFAGASIQRAATLDGAISNLGDSWDELFRTVNEAGVGDVMARSVRSASDALSGMSVMIRENRLEIEVLTGAITGGALLATLPRLAAGLTAVAVGVRAIGLAMAANPLALVLLGGGAVVGGVAAYDSAYRKTADGMRKTIEQMEEANRMAAENLTGRSLRPEIVRDVNKAIAERTLRINELKSALSALDSPMGSVGSGDTALRRAQAEAPLSGRGGGGGGKPGTTAPQDAYAVANRYLETLKMQLQTTESLTVYEKLLADLRVGRLGKTNPALEAELKATAKQIDADKEIAAITAQFAQLNEQAAARQRALADEARSVWDSTRTPLEKLNTEQARLQQLLDAGAISFDTYARASLNLEEAYRGNTETVEELSSAAMNASKRIQDTLGDSLVDALTGNFDDIGSAFAKMMQRILAEAAAAEVMDALFGKVGVGGKRAGNSTLTTFLASIFPSAKGNVFASVPGLSAYSSQVVSKPTLFPFAKGIGLMGEAGAEAIMPLRRDSAGRLGVSAGGGAAANITVKLINESGTQLQAVSQRQTTGPDGSVQVEVLLRSLKASIGDDLANRSGDVSRGLEVGWGLRPNVS